MTSSLSNKIVLITGASSGIGEACAHALGKEGSNLILIARRAERLEALSDHLTSKYRSKVLVLPLDITQINAVQTTLDQLDSDWKSYPLHNSG